MFEEEDRPKINSKSKFNGKQLKEIDRRKQRSSKQKQKYSE